MKKTILKISLIILLSVSTNYAYSLNTSYYRLIEDKLTKQTTEKEHIEEVFSNSDLIISEDETIYFSGCDFKHSEENKQEINNRLNKSDFFRNYKNELKKYHLTTNSFSKLYYRNNNDTLENNSDSSDQCNEYSNIYSNINIILLDNNELMIPYKNQLFFFHRLSNEDEKKLNDLYNNEKCLDMQEKEGMVFIDVCYYQHMSILDVYDAMSTNPAYIFREKIGIGENRSVTYEDKVVDVEYKWKGKNKLEIIQRFAGGETSYIFKHKKNGTKLTTIHSPD
ncbi:hypothetical protein GY065_11255 [Snodgrassella sp. ESL0323]|uniref:hypothetical protein n=1 Tax=Snodgrassella TaxID=1193515 RepID=UPI001582C9FE|nr:hypothetical protein [Snodgrassella sp. ESL0323]NUF79473.1 hypothetical protein [Snodgrassella sp. ESL0323]